jgi:hypothetical protein
MQEIQQCSSTAEFFYSESEQRLSELRAKTGDQSYLNRFFRPACLHACIQTHLNQLGAHGRGTWHAEKEKGNTSINPRVRNNCRAMNTHDHACYQVAAREHNRHDDH